MKFSTSVLFLAIIATGSCQRAQLQQIQTQGNNAINSARDQVNQMASRIPPPFSMFARLFLSPFMAMSSMAQGAGNAAIGAASNMIPSMTRSGFDNNDGYDNYHSSMRQGWGGQQMGGSQMGGQQMGGSQMGQMGRPGQFGGRPGRPGMGQGQSQGQGFGGRPGMMAQQMQSQSPMGGGPMGGGPMGGGPMGGGMGGPSMGGSNMGPMLGQMVGRVHQFLQSPEGRQMIQMVRPAVQAGVRAFFETLQQQLSGGMGAMGSMGNSMSDNMSQGMSQGMGQMGQMGSQAGQMGSQMGQMGSQAGQVGQNQMGQMPGQAGQMGQMPGQAGQMGQMPGQAGQMSQGMGQMGQGGQMGQAGQMPGQMGQAGQMGGQNDQQGDQVSMGMRSDKIQKTEKPKEQ